jgi:hypothetical protein
MKITKQAGPPEDLLYFDDEVNLTPLQVEDVVEIFNTPLTGSYNWDYTVADNRIKKLYELGKELNWNGSIDLKWDYTHPADEKLVDPDEQLPHEALEAYQNLTEEEKILFDRHSTAELMSQFLHGEQGALLVASQLASCAPTYNAKLYAASQTFDEARHVEVFNRYLQEKIGIHYPINPALKQLLDKILTDERWDLKFIGMQIIIEGLALAAFQMLKTITKDPLLKQLLHYVVRDEARHVTFGINYLEDYIKTLSPEEAREFQLNTATFDMFRNFLFSRVIPNLSRIGLLTDNVRPKFEALGLLEYEHAPDDFECDWTELKKPLESFDKIPEAI